MKKQWHAKHKENGGGVGRTTKQWQSQWQSKMWESRIEACTRRPGIALVLDESPIFHLHSQGEACRAQNGELEVA